MTIYEKWKRWDKKRLMRSGKCGIRNGGATRVLRTIKTPK